MGDINLDIPVPIKKELPKGTPYGKLGIYEKREIDGEIIDMFVHSYSTTEIIKHLQDKWGMGNMNSILDTIKRVKKKFFDVETEKCNEQKRAGYLAQYQNLLKIAVDKAVKTGSTKNAKELIDSMTKLEGLHIDRQEVKVVDTFDVQF